ncbi:hypothetical protein [Gilliamella sp. wkB195]|uniref:hypothetical protein n=1 Tax=Gilliamella sp. wkB195 TaxID=3120261 RepID=UPI00159ECA6F|nr:hypothetical protein [Gilliamella apicola]
MLLTKNNEGGMKKIVLLGFIRFILTGCGDDKVTNDYLVGNWDCNGEKIVVMINSF